MEALVKVPPRRFPGPPGPPGPPTRVYGRSGAALLCKASIPGVKLPAAAHLAPAPEHRLGGDFFTQALLGDVSPGEDFQGKSRPSLSKISSSPYPLPFPILQPSRVTVSGEQSSPSVPRLDIGNVGSGALRQALSNRNEMFLRKVREEEQHEVFRNVCDTTQPMGFRLHDEPLVPSVPGSHFAGSAMLDHSDLVKRCAQGYRAPDGAPPHLRNMIDKAVTIAATGLAKSSGSKYARAWRKWTAWVDEFTVGDDQLPLDPVVSCGKHEIVAAYITDLVSQNGSISSAQSTLSALQYYIGLTNMPFHKSSFLEAVMKGLKRQFANVPEKQEGFTTGQVVDLLNHFMTAPDSLITSLRLAALIVVCYFGAARFEEAAGLRFTELSLSASGNAVIDFSKGKTNQFRKRFQTVIKNGYIMGTDFSPVSILMDYRKLLSQSIGGPPVMLFPQFVSKVVGDTRVQSVKGDGSTSVSYDNCKKTLGQVLKSSDFRDKHGISDSGYGWHSFRVGSLSAQAAKKVAPHLMQAQARHANIETTMGYVNSVESEKVKASAALLEDMPATEEQVAVENTIDSPEFFDSQQVNYTGSYKDSYEDEDDVCSIFSDPPVDDCEDTVKDILLESYSDFLDPVTDDYHEKVVAPPNQSAAQPPQSNVYLGGWRC